MLQISQKDINALKSIKSQLDSLLGNAGITMNPGKSKGSAACEGCSNTCSGVCTSCKGCTNCHTTSSSLGDRCTLDDIRTALDNLDTLGPVVFNKKFLSELFLQKSLIVSNGKKWK